MLPMQGTDNLPPKQKAKLVAAIENLHAKKSLDVYNSVVEQCFAECVHDFRRNELDRGEETCVSKCCEKYINCTQRVSQKFGELSADMERQLAEQMSKMQK